jgi:ribosomal protein L17
MTVKVMNKMEDFKKVKSAIDKAISASNTLTLTESKLLDNIHESLEKAQSGIKRFIKIVERKGDVG